MKAASKAAPKRRDALCRALDMIEKMVEENLKMAERCLTMGLHFSNIDMARAKIELDALRIRPEPPPRPVPVTNNGYHADIEEVFGKPGPLDGPRVM